MRIEHKAFVIDFRFLVKQFFVGVEMSAFSAPSNPGAYCVSQGKPPWLSKAFFSPPLFASCELTSLSPAGNKILRIGKLIQ